MTTSIPAAHDRASVEVAMRWSPSALTLSVVTCAAAALAVAVIGSSWQLLAFAAPLIGVLASVLWQQREATVRVTASPGLVRCFETEDAEIEVRFDTTDSSNSVVRVAPTAVRGLDVEADGDTLRVSAQRWGRYLPMVRVEATAAAGLLVGTADAQVGEVHVYPLAATQRTPIPRIDLPDRLGTHLTRHHGPGVEYADIRPYVPGDQLRVINWPVSARRGRLHVTERLTDRAADVVVVIDTYDQAPGPATEATERSVRGATQVVQSALQRGDRTGIIGLGRAPRWLAPDMGRRQFYRILDTVLAVGDEFASTTGTLAHRAALPPGALVVAFSTLLDTEFALSLIDLRKRGHPVVAVDVLRGPPFEDELTPGLARMWRLERAAMYRDMGTVGVDIVAWREGITLDLVLQLVPDHAGKQRVRR
ncbi:DUF58 domain-containing protein [Antrihabitans spumae]|jgi:uncharacterized protein (DUF58 family)|uniref:DUF58 domain-containing protein n=1 Tax=Antrihabitans spumae TaxID=3373370 RepID=A0ABW7KHM0_9NOCA